MIAYVTGGKTLPKEIAEQIIDRTDGVPLFIEELTKTVLESGLVTEAGDHYVVAGRVVPWLFQRRCMHRSAAFDPGGDWRVHHAARWLGGARAAAGTRAQSSEPATNQRFE